MTLANERASKLGKQNSTYINAPVLDPTTVLILIRIRRFCVNVFNGRRQKKEPTTLELPALVYMSFEYFVSRSHCSIVDADIVDQT